MAGRTIADGRFQQRAGTVVGEAFSGPVAGGAEGGKQKAAEEHLLKKGRDRDAKAKSSQAARRVWKSLSMGALEGLGSTSSSIMASAKHRPAAAKSHRQRRKAVAAFHCKPAK